MLKLLAQLPVAAFLLWLYGGDLLRFVRAQSSPVTVMNELPSLPLSVLGTLVALGFTGTLLLERRFPPGWKPRRAAVLATLVLLLTDFLVLSSRRAFISAPHQLVNAVQRLAEVAREQSSPQGVPRDPRVFADALKNLGPIPIFLHGERVSAWQLTLRDNCDGPAADAQGAAAGTLIYCVSRDRQEAWVTVVATARAETFGEAAVVEVEGLFTGPVTRPPPQQAQEQEDEEEDMEEFSPDGPVWEPPTP